MIKYLGSKRTLAPVLGEIASAVGARTAVDLFTGTTRVAQELKRRGLHVTACDVASYSAVLSDCYVATDGAVVDRDELDDVIAHLNGLPGRRGYFTRTFCEDARFFQPKNGARVDAVREAVESSYRGTPLFPVLMTSLLEAADRVDSTTGVQMAYLKSWSARCATQGTRRSACWRSTRGGTSARRSASTTGWARRWGKVSHARNTEYLFVARGAEKVDAACAVAPSGTRR